MADFMFVGEYFVGSNHPLRSLALPNFLSRKAQVMHF
jgi:hypothetical protein